MTAPTVTAINFDQPIYTSGQTITTSIYYYGYNFYTSPTLSAAASDVMTGEMQATATTAQWNTASGSPGMPDPVSITLTDSRHGTWTLVSNVLISSPGANPYEGLATFTSIA
jgi:hypothetical protein